jgi:hypothetical protein
MDGTRLAIQLRSTEAVSRESENGDDATGSVMGIR